MPGNSAYAVLIALLLVARTASGGQAGGGGEQASEHRHHKEAAYTAFELGKYSQAISHFERAYTLKRDPRLLYNLALAYYRRHELTGTPGDLRQARELFRRFLMLVPLPGPRAPDHQKVRVARAYARSYLERIGKLDLVPPSRAGTPAAPSELRAGGGLPAHATSSRRARAPGAPRRQVSRERQASSGSTFHWWLYGLAGAAAVAAGVTGTLAISADHRSDDLAARRDSGADQEADLSEQLALTTDVLIGAAVVSVAVAVILHLVDRRGQIDTTSRAAASWRWPLRVSF